MFGFEVMQFAICCLAFKRSDTPASEATCWQTIIKNGQQDGEDLNFTSRSARVGAGTVRFVLKPMFGHDESVQNLKYHPLIFVCAHITKGNRLKATSFRVQGA